MALLDNRFLVQFDMNFSVSTALLTSLDTSLLHFSYRQCNSFHAPALSFTRVLRFGTWYVTIVSGLFCFVPLVACCGRRAFCVVPIFVLFKFAAWFLQVSKDTPDILSACSLGTVYSGFVVCIGGRVRLYMLFQAVLCAGCPLAGASHFETSLPLARTLAGYSCWTLVRPGRGR